MKQTAVEWFEQKLDDLDIEIPFGIFEQALEMEKEQIINAFDKGLITENIYYGYDDKKAEEYYNETFKSFCPCDGGIIVCPGCNGEQSKFGICAGCHGEGKVVCGKCGGKNNKSI